LADALPRLRFNLDFMPSPDPAKPGLFIRDPYHYSNATLLVPPPLVAVLECFDGQQSTLDLRSELVRITGEIEVSDLEKHLFDSLDEAGFLDNPRYRELKGKREAQFALESTRAANFSGSAYPANQTKLAELLTQRIGSGAGTPARSVATPRDILAIAAPHASPDGGWDTYRAAYRCLPSVEEAADKTFIILGTSHYGAPERFGLTRKNFITPYGEAQTDIRLVSELEKVAPNAVLMEDYCHAVEHSIEFQVVFLQHLYGPRVRILPILCGPFVKSIYQGGPPEQHEAVAQFLGALGNLAAREGRRAFWILAVDMAHMGRRYNDPIRATANIGEMLAIEQRDRERIARIAAADTDGFWSLVQEGHDDLKWCGSAPLYTFLKVLPGCRGDLLHYQQWQIDPQSVVSFGAMSFTAPETLKTEPEA
jgi:AmmeMemoRadiSam system protein B